MANDAQKRVREMFGSVTDIVAAYGEIDPGDFVLKEILESLSSVKRRIADLERAIEMCAPKKEGDSSGDYLRHLNMLNRMQRQQTDLLSRLAKHQETIFHKQRKTKSKNRSAPPGQQVGGGIAPFNPEEKKCATQG